MSNNPSSRVVARIQPSALIFVMLVLIMGALLLLSNNIDPNAGKRAQFTVTPVDPFIIGQYVSWKSPDGFIQLEHPSTWQPRTSQASPFEYLVVAPNTGSTFIYFQLTPIARFQGATPTTTPDQLAKLVIAAQPKDLPEVTTRTVQVGSFAGVAVHRVEKATDQSTNQPILLERELWFVALDSNHVLYAEAPTQAGDWTKFQPIFEHVVNSLKIDSAAAIQAMDAAFPVTPPAAGAATVAPTQAATPAASQ